MKTFIKVVKTLAILWVAIVFYFLGYLIGHKNIVFEANLVPKVVNQELKKPKEVDFSAFWKAWDLVTEKYVGDYSPQKMVSGAIKGMVEGLGDPYSSYMEKSQKDRLKEDLSGEFEGIGAELSIKDSKLTVIAPLANSPAERAGLKSKDQILAINDETTSDLSLDEAVSKIRGKAGTEVRLLINRDGQDQPQEITIKRERIANASVTWEIKQNIGYIKITTFGADTAELAEQAARELANAKPKAVILDLRNNPGGYLDAAVDVSSLFVSSGQTVVKEQYKDGRKDELKTTLSPILKDYKTIVLINGGSASASEIVAGALQDIKGATLVGEKSFGKGTVQELQELTNGAELRITVAKWLTPKDRAIDKEGIKPTVEVKLTQDDHDNNRDPQLDKAIELGAGN